MNLEKIPLDYSFIPSINKGMTDGSRWMLLLHGRGDSKASYELLAKEINLTGLNYLALNAPFSMSAGFMQGYSWYDEHFDPNEAAYLKSIELLVQVIDTLNEQGIESEDIFILGFSQGGRMALDIVHHLQAPLAGVAALSPRMSPFIDLKKATTAATNTPLYIAHGALDPVIPYNETLQQVRLWQQYCPQLIFKTYEIEHEIDIMEIIELRKWLNDLI